MVKVVVRKLGPGKSERSHREPASTSVLDSKGKSSSFFTIDVKSPTFEKDLTFVYKHNVAKARRENRRMFGSADGATRSKAK